MGELGFLSVLHLILLVYAGVQILNSSADTANKVLWIVVVALLPLVGLIIWFFMGPGTPRK